MATLLVARFAHHCRRCGDALDVGDVIIDRSLVEDTESSTSAYHPECVLDVDPYAVRVCMDSTAVFQQWIAAPDSTPADPRWVLRSFSGGAINYPRRDELLALARTRVERIEELHREASARRRRKVTEPAQRAARSEISRDRKGRPRVSLLCAYIGREHLGDSGFIETQVLVDDTVTSSLREYVLVEMQKHAPVEFPWQPIVGAISVASTHTKITRRSIERFLQWKSMDLPEPVLFLVGPAGAQRDQCERTLRALLDEAGFVGDNATVHCASELTRECLSALGAALDEAISIEAPSVEVDLDARARALAVLEEVTREQRRDAYSGALALVHKQSRGMSAEMKARASLCAARCLAHEPAQKIALALLQSLPPLKGPAVLREAWISELSESRTVSKAATAIERELTRAKDSAMHAALLALIRAEKKASARALAWLATLASATDHSVASDLKTWADSLDDKDPRKQKALEVTALVERSATTKAERKPRA